MAVDRVQERLTKILVDQLGYTVPTAHIREDSTLYGKGLGLDSLDLVTLIVRLENEFDIFFESEDVSSSMETFGSLLRFVQQKLVQNGAETHRKEGG